MGVVFTLLINGEKMNETLTEINKLRRQNKILLQALQFYAGSWNWEGHGQGLEDSADIFCPVEEDQGHLARSAIKQAQEVV